MFPVYGGKCLSCKAVHSWVKTRGKRLTDDEEVETEVREWLRKQSNNSMLRESDGTSGSMLVEDMSINNFFPRFEYHMFYVLYPFVTYLLTVHCI
jgi:hypothetical protein